MSAKLTHRQYDTLSAASRRRIEQRQSGASGVHADQNRRHGGKAARGGRQGQRQALLREVWA